MLEIRDVTIRYGAHKIVDRLTLPPMPAGRVVALVGPNGAGKSTLIKAVAGILAHTGTIVLQGRTLSAVSRAERGRRIAFMPQSIDIRSGLSVLECVVSVLQAAGAGRLAMSRAEAEARAMAALQRLEIGALALSPLDRLSGGQRQLASMAQAIVLDPQVLLLDEPTSALDPAYQAHVMSLAGEMAREGRLVIAALHDLTLAARHADDIAVLSRGGLAAFGEPATIVTPDLLAKVYGISARVERCSQGTMQVIVDGRLKERADQHSAASEASMTGSVAGNSNGNY